MKSQLIGQTVASLRALADALESETVHLMAVSLERGIDPIESGLNVFWDGTETLKVKIIGRIPDGHQKEVHDPATCPFCVPVEQDAKI